MAGFQTGFQFQARDPGESQRETQAARMDVTFKTSMSFAYGEPAPMGPGIVRLVAITDPSGKYRIERGRKF